MNVLLVQMPFGSLRWPSPALGLLQSLARERGHRCDTAYLTFDLAELVGEETYQWITDSFGFVLGGERLFARHYFETWGDEESRQAFWSDEEYRQRVLQREDPSFTDEDHKAFLDVGRAIPAFLNTCRQSIDWSAYDIVGFSATFQQVMPSVCLARHLREAGINPTIVLGGAASENSMGQELVRQFEEIDFACLGEADRTFPDLLDALESNDEEALNNIPGIAHRNRDVPGMMNTATPTDMDALPSPDFDAYFDRLNKSPLRESIDPLLLFETSRGCWWGERRHCRFCGLNGDRIAYRRKSPERIVDELRRLVERYGIHKVCTTDNVFDPRFFEELLPLLADAELGVRFEQELRPRMSKDDWDRLIAAGLGAAQLGIETFNTRLLRAIGKGTTAMDNLLALRRAAASRVETHWNFLYGFPEETDADYAGMADLIEAIPHFPPPNGVGRVRLDRFSPYFESPEKYGIHNARPKPAFYGVYPFEDKSVRRLAYYFDFDLPNDRSPELFATPVLRMIHWWRSVHNGSTFTYNIQNDESLFLLDLRPNAAYPRRVLHDWEANVYLQCEESASLEELAAAAPSEDTLKKTLDRWKRDRLILAIDNRYLSLAVPGYYS
jgi:ribosomal peptide maturation radical SAM protein 1